jgi:hypothetical protein
VAPRRVGYTLNLQASISKFQVNSIKLSIERKKERKKPKEKTCYEM